LRKFSREIHSKSHGIVLEFNINLLQKGDEREFARLVQYFGPKVYSTCFFLLQSKTDAEDVAQEVFTAVFVSLPKFKGESSISTWIYRIAVNKCTEFKRFNSRQKRFGLFVAISEFLNVSVDKKPDDFLIEDERKMMLLKCLDELPENQKIAYTLFHFEDKSYAEICEIMETTIGAVESLMFRAKQQLKIKLSERLKDVPKEKPKNGF
jgi:RNA polymerase sigma factor (sigma-70 family)